MKIAIAADHGGVNLKNELVEYVAELGHEILDQGTDGSESVDYPDYARKVTDLLAAGGADLGILVCGTGQGMAMSANKLPGIRAGVVSDTFSARMIRAHNNANILCLGERVIGAGLARELTKAFLETDFEGGRHERRVAKIEGMGGGG
ncbi:MAG: ribose 5-phosphate isomerase B [Chrysiogenetes bacterium]|nr:ribose 5-phosphate isomerase B [Chrysiogenetes bacterium]